MPVKIGKHTLDYIVPTRLDIEDLEQLDKLAQDYQVKRGSAIRLALRDYFLKTKPPLVYGTDGGFVFISRNAQASHFDAQSQLQKETSLKIHDELYLPKPFARSGVRIEGSN